VGTRRYPAHGFGKGIIKFMTIGVVDSGVGGLTVLRALKKVMPDRHYIYAGDTARAPYGGRSPNELQTFGREIVNFLMREGADAVVLACGTLSSTAYEILCEEFPLPVIDVLRPGASAVRAFLQKYAAKNPAPPRIGILATQATVNSGFFEGLLRAQYPDIILEARACPLFAPMVERGVYTGEEARQTPWGIYAVI
jgi:glutamate racemase